MLVSIIKIQFSYINGVHYVNTHLYNAAFDHFECALRNINIILPALAQDTLIYPGLSDLKRRMETQLLFLTEQIKEEKRIEKEQQQREEDEFILYEHPNTLVSFFTSLIPCWGAEKINKKNETMADLRYKITMLQKTIQRMDKEKQD
jgi:hypothetical protein